ncbi:MAG: hypothetical protein ACXV76_13790, partial [Halobacteriota archaeon]
MSCDSPTVVLNALRRFLFRIPRGNQKSIESYETTRDGNMVDWHSDRPADANVEELRHDIRYAVAWM